jgi:hypothetical protein
VPLPEVALDAFKEIATHGSEYFLLDWQQPSEVGRRGLAAFSASR